MNYDGSKAYFVIDSFSCYFLDDTNPILIHMEFFHSIVSKTLKLKQLKENLKQYV